VRSEEVVAMETGSAQSVSLTPKPLVPEPNRLQRKPFRPPPVSEEVDPNSASEAV